MKALITGGAGFIGSNLAEGLLNRGIHVRVLDDLSSGYRQNLDGMDVEFVEGDVRHRETVDVAVRDCDLVFHLAASVGNKRSIDDPVRDSEVNVLGTLNVLEASRRAGVRKIVASSSAGIYGELRTLPIAEDHPVEPLTPYGASKLCMEKQCLAHAHVHGLDAVCLRYFNVYGPRQRFDAYGNVIPIFVFNALDGKPIVVFGDGRQTRDFVNVDDVVQANIAASVAEGVSGAFNIASATQTGILDLAEQVRDGLSPEVVIEFGDVRPGDVEHSLADISAAKAAFGYSPRVTLSEGLPRYLAWARQEHSSLRHGA